MRLRAALLGVLAFAGVAEAGVVDRIAAVVNDDVIALSELYEEGGSYIQQKCGTLGSSPDCVLEAELEVLDALMFRVLVQQELERLDLQVTPEELDRAIDQIMRQNGIEDRESLKRQVEASGLSWDLYREQLRKDYSNMKFVDTVLAPRISVSDDEVLDFYNRTKRDMAAKPMRKLEALAVQAPPAATPEERHQLVALLAQVADEVNAGERDWQESIQTWDSGVYAPRKGDMGEPYSPEMLLAPMRDRVFATEVGKVTAPIELGQSVYLVKTVSEELIEQVIPFDEAAEQIRMQIYQEKRQEEQEQWYLQARRQAATRILLVEQ